VPFSGGSNYIPAPFLPVREEFHSQNQARQKLAILPITHFDLRFDDLFSDVHLELACRYPEFKEDVRLLSFWEEEAANTRTGPRGPVHKRRGLLSTDGAHCVYVGGTNILCIELITHIR
jgi:hypothetical protein